MRKRYIALLLTGLGALGVAMQATASDDGGGRPSRDFAQISAVEGRAAQSLSVLTSSRSAADAMPTGVARRMDADAPFGMNPALARRAIGNATHSVFVIPARDHVCASLTLGEGANLSCPTTDAVVTGRAGPATVGFDHGTAIYGLVPDGVESVTVHAAAAEEIRVVTSNNAYYTVVPEGTPLRYVRYVGPSGPVEFRIYDPNAVFEEG